MEQNEFIVNFAEQFDETDASEIQSSTGFHDLEEWSSLTAMSVIALAKIQYGKSITVAEIKSCITVQDLYNLIKNKL